MKESVIAFNPPPESYDITEYFEQVFMMFEGKECTVHLLCDNGLMKTIIDRFGEDVETRPFDNTSFIAVVEVSVSPTFYSWVFTFGGKIKIAEPTEIKEEYKKMLKEALK